MNKIQFFTIFSVLIFILFSNSPLFAMRTKKEKEKIGVSRDKKNNIQKKQYAIDRRIKELKDRKFQLQLQAIQVLLESCQRDRLKLKDSN
jgi:hypothetical protein